MHIFTQVKQSSLDDQEAGYWLVQQCDFFEVLCRVSLAQFEGSEMEFELGLSQKLKYTFAVLFEVIGEKVVLPQVIIDDKNPLYDETE